jgi:lysophospholipase L1-like esterase
MSRALSMVLAVAMGFVGVAGPARAAEGADCKVASSYVPADYGLPRVAAAINSSRRLVIAVVGTGSSILAGGEGAKLAYPNRLEAALSKQLPGVQVRVVSYAHSRRTAADMVNEFKAVLAENKPSLVIWQTGTVDAIRGVDPDEFRARLDKGVTMLHAGGADVVLMNMQYSPRTEMMIAIGAYAEAMRVVSQQREVPLFDRLSVMRHWNETGTFDLYAGTRDLKTASRVHDCIGQLLADLIIEDARMAKPSQ